MTQTDKFKARLDEIQRLADAINRHKTDLMEAAAYDAGFPVTITSIEVELSVDHLRTMEKEIPWVKNGRSYGTVATIFPYDAPTVVLARLGGAALLTGNALRFSLSSQTPRSASVLAEICKPFQTIQPAPHYPNQPYDLQRCRQRIGQSQSTKSHPVQRLKQPRQRQTQPYVQKHGATADQEGGLGVVHREKRSRHDL